MTRWFLRQMRQSRVMLVLISVYFLSGCGSGCEDAVKTEMVSPNGRYMVSIIERDCGATTDFSTLGHIQRKGQKLNVDTGIFLVLAGRWDVIAEWKGETNLIVRIPKAEIFKRETSVDGVAIEYEAEK